MGFLDFSRNFVICYFWFFAHWCKMAMCKIWQSLSFEKKIFWAILGWNGLKLGFFGLWWDFRLKMHFCISLISSWLIVFYLPVFNFYHQVGPFSLWLVFSCIVINVNRFFFISLFSYLSVSIIPEKERKAFSFSLGK